MRVGACGLAVAAACVLHDDGADAHGTLTLPISRALQFASNSTRAQAAALSGNCEHGACEWYQQDTVIPGEVTNCDPTYRTMGVGCGSENPIDYPCTPGNAVPWCAPGSAPVTSPCGVFAGGGPLLPDGRDMLDLDGPPTETWAQGSTQRVGWSMIANHGGGYSFRLCNKAHAQTEECFAAGSLKFAGASTFILNASGAVVATIPAVRLSKGTHPRGSEWTRNPIPLEIGMIPSIPGLPQLAGRGPFPFSVVDEVRIPSSLPDGNYTISWRWDAEQTKQVWSQCGDVRIGRGPPTQAAVQEESVDAATARPLCIGDSLGLSMSDCTAWVEIYDALNGEHWIGGTPAARLDPCGATWTDWTKSIVCTQERDMKHISEIYLMGQLVPGTTTERMDVTGVLPDSINQLQHLVALSIVNSGLAGHLPPSLGDIPSLKMIWLDHNAQLGGAIPITFAHLNLTVLEIHYSNFSGPLPPLNYAAIPDCTMYNGNWSGAGASGHPTFACPLPQGADTCGAVCV